MKREREQREDCYEDEARHPATTQWHGTHHPTPGRLRGERSLLNSSPSNPSVDSGGTIRTFLFLGLLAAFQPALAQTDPRAGNWTLTAAQTSLDPPNKLTITTLKDGIHVVMTGQTHLDFTASSNGHDSPAPGNPAFNQIKLHRIDKKQAEVKELKDGSLVATVREKISADGNELTSTTVTPGHPDQIAVWTHAGAKNPNDAFGGEWTQDLSKSRMRQGLTVKVEPDGKGGVRFSSDFSYTARFDGKPYDLKNSRNDTVSLELVDPHTVDATYRRDNQVTQKDRWVVSGDGQQMTVSTTGTLENGQRLTEKLTFRKQ